MNEHFSHFWTVLFYNNYTAFRFLKSPEKGYFYHSFLFTLVKSDTLSSVLHQIIIKLIIIILSVKDQTTADFLNYHFERITKCFVVSDI